MHLAHRFPSISTRILKNHAFGSSFPPSGHPQKILYRPLTRLIYAMDGTDDKPYNPGGKDEKPVSNVMRIARSVKPIGSDGAAQFVRYNWGIGTQESNEVDSKYAEATGKGMAEDLLNAYGSLVLNYEPDSNMDIFLIGFSRGAFTALSIAGMIEQVGLIPKNKLKGNMIIEAYNAYQGRKQDDPNKDDAPKRFREKYNTFYPVNIAFLGLFDTVAALSVREEAPDKGKWQMAEEAVLDIARGMFHLAHGENVKVTAVSKHIEYCPSNVDHAFHAVSIDEDRKEFAPTLLHNNNKCKHLQEIWFPGCHQDVGGGYKERQLSNEVLRVMAKEMESHGVTFYPDFGTDEKGKGADVELKFHKESLPPLVYESRRIPGKATLHEKVAGYLKSDEKYQTYCNPHLKGVDDDSIKKSAQRCNGGR